MIKLQVIGNLGKDCLVNQVNGKNVINFSVAHTEKYKDSTGNQKEKTTWVECAYWTDRIAISPYLKKGTQVFVEGIPDVRHYTRNDGTAGASLTLRVQSIQLVGNKEQSDTGGVGTPQAYPSAGSSSPMPASPAPSSFEPEPRPAESEVAEDLPF